MYRCFISSCQGKFLPRRFYTSGCRLRPSSMWQPSSSSFKNLSNYELPGIDPTKTALSASNMTIVRCMSGHGSHRTDKEIDAHQKSTMNDLPVPEGSWQESYQQASRKNNIALALSSASLLVTVYAMYKCNCFAWNSGPNIKSIQIKPEMIGLTSAAPAVTLGSEEQEESSVGPDLEVVPVEEPAASSLVAEEIVAPAEEPAAPTPTAEEPAAPVVEEPVAPTPAVEEPAAPVTEDTPPPPPPEETPPPPPPEETPPPPAPEETPPPPAPEETPPPPAPEETPPPPAPEETPPPPAPEETPPPPTPEETPPPPAPEETPPPPAPEETPPPPAPEETPPPPPPEETPPPSPPEETPPPPPPEETPPPPPPEETPPPPPPEETPPPPPPAPEDIAPPPPAADTLPSSPPSKAAETDSTVAESSIKTAIDAIPVSKTTPTDWSKIPDIPAHVTYLLVGAGTASFAAFS